VGAGVGAGVGKGVGEDVGTGVGTGVGMGVTKVQSFVGTWKWQIMFPVPSKQLVLHLLHCPVPL
jgi:hypothetical protein